jgi:hypothetical protein
MKIFNKHSIYFSVGFYDKAMQNIDITTLVFLGKNDSDLMKRLNIDETLWCFQDATSYFEIGAYNTLQDSEFEEGDLSIQLFDESSINRVRDINELIVVLEECAQRNG